ncbi:MAG: ADP-ribosylation factor-like protein [Promethearchaeota archaeon]
MVRVKENGDVVIKLLVWGCAGSGKTTAVDTLYKLTAKDKKNQIIKPIGDLTKIAMKNGSTLYFDRGVFQSCKSKAIYYHIFTVAGQTRFFPLRKKIFEGTDGIIFVFDSQKSLSERNLDSLKELKNITQGRLISTLPLLVMANKQDLEDPLRKKEIEEILRSENLFYSPGHRLSLWNPIVYETVALLDKEKNIFSVFAELSRRVALYQGMGEGKAPNLERGKMSKNVPDI